MSHMEFTYPSFEYHGRHKLNEELTRRYKHGYFGDREKTIRDDAAAARRAATQLENAAGRFAEILPPDQLQAMKAGASAMARLAQQLEQLKPWAQALKKHEEAERKARDLFKDERQAAERWTNEAAMRTEAALMAAFRGEEGAAWLIERHKVKEVNHMGLSHFQSLALDPAQPMMVIRTGLLAILRQLGGRAGGGDWDPERSENFKTHDGTLMRHAGWADWCAWRSAHAGASETAQNVLGRLAKVD